MSEADHPRLRGETEYGANGHGALAGSSPLARGNFAHESGCPLVLGIIPACAGELV